MSPLLLVLTLLYWSRPHVHGAAAAAVPKAAQEYLDAHNKARSEIGVGPLVWSPQLATASARVVTQMRLQNNCRFANLTGGAGGMKYGANQLWAAGMRVEPAAVVGAWVGEKRYYNHEKNTCETGHTCGVYTQVVWRKSTELGCSQGRCPVNASSLTICFYYPPGNIVGESPY